MKRYVCRYCDYIYDPEYGDPESDIPPETPFESLPAAWLCPKCGVGKDKFWPERRTGPPLS
jgi:rubredoxin